MGAQVGQSRRRFFRTGRAGWLRTMEMPVPTTAPAATASAKRACWGSVQRRWRKPLKKEQPLAIRHTDAHPSDDEY